MLYLQHAVSNFFFLLFLYSSVFHVWSQDLQRQYPGGPLVRKADSHGSSQAYPLGNPGEWDMEIQILTRSPGGSDTS